MKPGVSSLNPYAASYVPISKRDDNEKTHVTTKDARCGNESVQFGTPDYKTQNQPHGKASLGNAHGSYGSSSQNVNEVTDKQIVDEEFDMDLEYLQMTFPGISDQSLTDVYVANKGDLEATVDMLTQLEFYTVESSETLPDTLDIGDVSESGFSANSASLKLKNVAGETSASSSSS